MSGNLQSLRRRIDGARDLQGVVRSMKASAASSISQYEKAVHSLSDYGRSEELGLAAALRTGMTAPLPAETTPASKSIGAIVLGSDQRLVSGFNEILADFVTRSLSALPGNTRNIWAVGQRMQLLMTDIDLAHTVTSTVAPSVHGITSLVGQLLIYIQTVREHGKVDAAHVFYNHPT